MKKGFTLVELLTVIAIIAILAAIIFPVFGTAREQARRGACASNLKQIFQALEQYKLDEGAYPPALFTAIPAQGNNCPQNVQMGNAPSYLMPYIKNVDIFKCPNSNRSSKTEMTIATYPQGHALAGQVSRLIPGDNNSPALCYYTYDSYDIGRNAAGNGYEVRYALTWSNSNLNQIESQLSGVAYGDGWFNNPIGPKKSDTPRQLRYRSPDKTAVVTWCTYHRSYSGGQPNQGKNDIVLFLTGDAKPMDSRKMFANPYNERP